MKNQDTMDIVKDEATRFTTRWLIIGVFSITILVVGYFGVSYMIDKKTEEAKQVSMNNHSFV